MPQKNERKSDNFCLRPGNLYVVAGHAGSGALAIAERESGVTANGFSAVVLQEGDVKEWIDNSPQFLDMSRRGSILIDARSVPHGYGYNVAKDAQSLAVETNSVVCLVVQMRRMATVDNPMLGVYEQFATGILIVDKESS